MEQPDLKPVHGVHLGEVVSENAAGHAAGHVYTLGVDARLPTGRGYQSDRSPDVHTESAVCLSVRQVRMQ